jgi:hypothetical protein
MLFPSFCRLAKVISGDEKRRFPAWQALGPYKLEIVVASTRCFSIPLALFWLEKKIYHTYMQPICQVGNAMKSNQSPTLLGRVREAIRHKHYSIMTERTYVEWVRRFVLFHGVGIRVSGGLGVSGGGAVGRPA